MAYGDEFGISKEEFQTLFQVEINIALDMLIAKFKPVINQLQIQPYEIASFVGRALAHKISTDLLISDNDTLPPDGHMQAVRCGMNAMTAYLQGVDEIHHPEMREDLYQRIQKVIDAKIDKSLPEGIDVNYQISVGVVRPESMRAANALLSDLSVKDATGKEMGRDYMIALIANALDQYRETVTGSQYRFLKG